MEVSPTAVSLAENLARLLGADWGQQGSFPDPEAGQGL